MSYRTVKKLLGETSLERKCRFLFGSGLMLLISGSFYIYARLNATLVEEQNKTMARLMIPSVVARKHWEWLEGDEDRKTQLQSLNDDLKPADMKNLGGILYRARVRSTKVDESKPASNDSASIDDETQHALYPLDEHEQSILARLKDKEPEVIDLVAGANEYNYYAPVVLVESCRNCHAHRDEAGLENDELIGMVKLTLPLQKTQSVLAINNAVLWTTAIVTTVLAMLAVYAIVRYVIVKPVLHLKDVSDKIARGMLDLRADIRTGDEFEELSHAFNRMLRHLTTVQDELREVNDDLDGKVDELAHVNLRLYEMNKLKDEFLATMSHELRTPLNSILGFSDIVAGAENLTDKQKRFVENIQNSGRELMMLINDLLDLAKIESGKMALQIVEFSLDDLVQRQADSITPMALKKNIELSCAIDSQLPPIFQDPGKLQQILNNLLSNAVKFTPEGGRVQVRADKVDDELLELIVEDTGIGIALEDQATIFEKFRQGKAAPGQHDTMTRVYGGTGLGLSIVKELTKLLGGELHLESEFGKGSTFRVRLPMQFDPPPAGLDTEFLGHATAPLRGLNDPLPDTTVEEDPQDENAA
ncbi:MAG: HAMP domain-containing protein [Planctomycetaceae bacterium]|jgi:two-component system, NarL family, sensor histidine kinase BarA|nr:HAMP domain-containing protein [Planctomycetaceae bacterium]MBT6483692.1 HAMP domain-containing protein [Planctomycetaceae bacterium]MBT6493018.1 HAMP domain-containing protein [Planctomycetaceae bacterium]